MSKSINTADNGYMNAELASRKWAFEVPPAPVPESSIDEEVKAELVVVGEGFAGLCTALSAAEEGVDVLIVTASSRPVGRGGSVFAAYSKVMERLGYPRQEVENFYLQEFAANAYNIDQRKWYRFYNNSEKAMNWLTDMLESAGLQVVLEDGMDDDPESPSSMPVGTHTFIGGGVTFAGIGIILALKVLEEKFRALGGRVAYKNIAKQLVREDGGKGRVSGVIATDSDGRCVKYSASKAVVLATGDFSANHEMMAKYCPGYARYFGNESNSYDVGFVKRGLYKGDGHLMALWAGAAWQKTFPNAVMIQGSAVGSNLPYGAHRGLKLNKQGERFSNEDCNAPYAELSILREQDGEAFAIWGTNYAYDIPWRFHGGQRGGPMTPPDKVIERWEKDVAAGHCVRCDTIEEVVEKLGLPKERAMAEINRYNELCRKGCDEDFHKKAKYLQEIKEGPFYGSHADDIWAFTVMGGPRTDHLMRICDERDVPLGGLYAVGTIAGDMYANCYNFRIGGHNYGCCLTFGYLTGKLIAGTEA